MACSGFSVTLLAFMAKHYGLTDAIWQNTNFVVFPQLFGAITVDGLRFFHLFLSVIISW